MYFDPSQRPRQLTGPGYTQHADPAGANDGGFGGRLPHLPQGNIAPPGLHLGGQMPRTPFPPQGFNPPGLPPGLTLGGPGQAQPFNPQLPGTSGPTQFPQMQTGDQLLAQRYGYQFQNPNTGIVPPNIRPGYGWRGY